jgi:hypothetical protein
MRFFWIVIISVKRHRAEADYRSRIALMATPPARKGDLGRKCRTLRRELWGRVWPVGTMILFHAFYPAGWFGR